MDSERELALRVTLYLAYLRELSDIEQSDWRFLDAIPAEASQIERLLDRKWDANRDRAAHNFAELRRTAQLVSIDYFQESSAEDAPPILRHRRTWPRTSEPMSRLGDLAALVKRLFCADAGSLRTLLGHVPLPMVRRTTPGEEGGGGSGPSREEVRWLLTERFYAEPELIYQVATALDYYTGFVLAIANAAEKQREENASYPLLDKRRLVRWFQPAFWKGVRKRIQDRLGFAHAPVLQDDAEFQAFVDPVRPQTAPAGWLSRLKASLRSRPEMERPEQRMRRMAEALLKDRALRTRMANKLGLPVPFGVVLADEVEELNKRPHDRAPDRPSASPWTRAWGRQSIALCCSGGGIRSATFSLGVIQALADLQLLRKLDYLSTVSGGGYIGSWLVTWIKRAGSVTKVEEFLAPGRTTNPQSDDNRPIRRLREYSNYLAPKVGGLSADTWSIFTIWSRNTSINFAVILPVLIALMLTPRLWEIVQAQMTSGLTFLLNRSAGWFVMAPATFFLVLACISIGHNLASFDVSRRRGRTGMQGDNDSRVIQLVLMPSVMAAFFSGAAMWAAGGSAPYKEILGAAAFVLFVAMMLMQLQGTFWERFGSDPDAGGARG